MRALQTLFAIAGLALFLGGHAASSQDSTSPGAVDIEGPLEGVLVSEELRQSPQVSGVRVLGYAALPATRGVPEFVVRVPDEWIGGTVCMRVQTADALYEAAAEVNLPAQRAGALVPLVYDSEFHEAFWQARAEALTADGLAVLVSVGACAATLPGLSPALPVLRATNPGSAPVLLLNTFRAEDGFSYVEGSQDTGRCEAIAAPVRTAYDMRCEIPLSAAASEGTAGAILITVWPIKDGELGLPIEVSVWAFP